MKFNIDVDDYTLNTSTKPDNSKSTSEKVEKTDTKINEIKETETNPDTITEPVVNAPVESAKEQVKPAKKVSAPEKKKTEKHPGGRPKKEITRKQYTLTLREDDYKRAMERAAEDDISFAKLVEKALKEYIGY